MSYSSEVVDALVAPAVLNSVAVHAGTARSIVIEGGTVWDSVVAATVLGNRGSVVLP